MAFKIAYGAGHYLHEAGKRLPRQLDANETREWTLNDRVARYFAEAAAQYEDVELLRTDDPTGETEVNLQPRCDKANAFDANLALSIHHNAGAELTEAGGIVAYSYYNSTEGAKYRDIIYDACIAAGGLKGNRAEPKNEAGFHVLKHTHMPAVLMEYGFMDSLLDAPVILQEEYSKKMGYATMEGIARAAGLKKKVTTAPDVAPVPSTSESGKYTLEQFVRDVQAATGSSVDGIAGQETIGNTVTVSAYKNQTHEVVAAIQKRLAALGYDVVGEPDGVAGPKFEAAVLAFQEDNRCWVDGELTAKNKTWQKLLEMI
ncbi:MAG: N-acetylmuramoyl-L-alanine amidase [Oscillospiraceae bacterium]|nr:N-acetylmuramoyl-L-alanine amidase [Oscillospiraceae bacterium]